jgi:hypothetical protein
VTALRLCRAGDVVEEELDGELLLLRRGASEAAHLNAVASTMWRLLEEPLNEDQLAMAVAEVFDVKPDRVRADLRPVLQLLRDNGLVVEVG